MSYHYFEIYPTYDPKQYYPLFYVEFTAHNEGDKVKWRLFKRNFFDQTKEEFDKRVSEYQGYPLVPSLECHPWQLENGEVDPENIISMSTKSFLKFMVDSLNKNVKEI